VRPQSSSEAKPAARGTALARLARELAGVPVRDARTPDDILGYDEVGFAALTDGTRGF
jgi:hypothetical protein